MKLSRHQQIALLFLEQAWCPQCWTAIHSAIRMDGGKHGNGSVTAKSLVKLGLVEAKPDGFLITNKGREVAKTISVTLQIEQAPT